MWCDSGVDLAVVGALNGELERFVGEVFVPGQPVAGAERRADMCVHHLRGSLLTDVKRKTATGMGRVLGVSAQSLNHLVTDSPWRWEPVQNRIAARAQRLLRPAVWAIDDTTFLKDGHDSVGVARQHSGRVGGQANCQAAVSVTACGRTGVVPLAWRLFMPESWNPELSGERRGPARVPDDVRHRPKWQLALDALDELAEQKLTPPPVVADEDYGRAGEFRDGLAGRGLGFVVQVNHDISLLPWRREPDTAWAREGKHLPATGIAAGATKTPVSWHTDDGERVAHFSLLRVREAGRPVRQRASAAKTCLPDRWLLIQWDTKKPDEPAHVWLAHLPGVARPTITRLVRLAKARWAIETSYRELKNTLGIDHFEGRTWPGWHRHVTLVTAALLFLTEYRARTLKNAAPA
ncbi:IS4 family transposase [Amycolatopsis sulphurea]|uniref:IS4 family transposase n=1 Tax=Amycolatopsis sulphurea TaxID=76022 RepID=A0A2A9FDG1_9PSEU|nr:SRSO17 transposase [Amycolatopsis sulphurea]PFG49341.1 SRSO17 transposase [Amycolatopsis sulphurea]PFG50962.1 IS4 family transposase [Amycolatopsis sulphurea]